MDIKYSHKDVAVYALNYAISKLHGNEETFKQYFVRVQDLRNVKCSYSNEPIYSFKELDNICTKYCDDSMKDLNLVFDKWYNTHLRYYKIKKIKDAIK